MRNHVRRLAFLALTLAASWPSAARAQDPPRPPDFPPGLPPGMPPGMPDDGAPGGMPKPDKPPPARDVSLKTADGLDVAGTFVPARKEGGAGVVLLHMYRSDRSAWKPLYKALQNRGIAALAIDMRGHGDSAKQGKKDLAPRVAKRDAKLFNAMHQDASAAIDWLRGEGKCDPKRIAVAGASVGCSVAIDVARRRPEDVAAVLCMTPGAGYLGVDTLKHLETFPEETPLLLMSHESELAAGSTKIVEARPATQLITFTEDGGDDPQPGWAHGTKMFGKILFCELTVASFLARGTGSVEDVVIDGDVGGTPPHVDPWSTAVDVAVGDASGWVRAFRVGDRVLFGGRAEPGIKGLRFEVQHSGRPVDDPDSLVIGPPSIVTFDLEKGEPTWKFGGMASVPSFPGMPVMFGQTVPLVRRVVTDEGTSFEGEWHVPPLGDDGDPETGLLKLVVHFDKRVAPRPRGGGMPGAPDQAVAVPSR